MDVPIAAVAPLALLAVGFVVFCWVDLSRTETVRWLPRWGWAIVCAITVPAGGIVYLLWGRQE